jgi:hypothetical protein
MIMASGICAGYGTDRPVESAAARVANDFSFGYLRKAMRQINWYVLVCLVGHLRRRIQRSFRPPKRRSHYRHLKGDGGNSLPPLQIIKYAPIIAPEAFFTHFFEADVFQVARIRTDGSMGSGQVKPDS